MKKNIQEGVKRATAKIKEEEAKSRPTLQGTGSAGEGQSGGSLPIPKLTEAEKKVAAAKQAQGKEDKETPMIPLGTLAGHVKEAASRVGPEGRIAPDSDKVFISHAHKEFAKTPHGKGMSLDEFKNNLKLMNTNRHLDLSRADMVEAMNPKDVKESETLHRPMGNQGSGSAFHFVRAEQAKRAEGQPAEGATQGEGQAGEASPSGKAGETGQPNPPGEPSPAPPRKIKLAGKSPAQRRAVVAVANALQARQAFNEAKGRGDGEETLNSLRERANSLSQAAQPHLKAARKEGKVKGETPGPKLAEGTAEGQPATGQPKAPEKLAPDQPEPAKAMTPHEENISNTTRDLQATMERQMGREVNPRKMAMAAINVIHGENPEVQKRLAQHLFDNHPDVYRAIREQPRPVPFAPHAFHHQLSPKPAPPASTPSPLGSPPPAKPEAKAKPVSPPSAPSAQAKPATPPATPQATSTSPKPVATATPKPSPAPAQPARDRSPEAASSRIQSRVRTALENVGRHPDNLAARKAMDRLRGRDLQAAGIAKAKEAGQAGYFGKLRGMREAGRSAPGAIAPPPAPAPSLPTVPYEGPGKGPIPSAKGGNATSTPPASTRPLSLTEQDRSTNLYRNANPTQLATLASRVDAPIPSPSGDPFKDRQLLADSITRTIHDNPNLGDRAWRAETSALLPAQLSDAEAEARRKESAFSERAPSRGSSYKSGNKNVHY